METMMQTLSAVFGGPGVIATAFAVILGAMVFPVIPCWADIDCIRARRDDTTETVGVKVPRLTWPFGSCVYGLSPGEEVRIDELNEFMRHGSLQTTGGDRAS